MSEFGILIFIFGVCVLLVGLYMFAGHEFSLVSWRAPFKGIGKSSWRTIGKWTMIFSIFIFTIAIIAFIFNI